MTIDELKASEKVYVTPEEISEVVGATAQSIRIAIRNNQHALGFGSAVIGTRTKIPRKPFLQSIGELDV